MKIIVKLLILPLLFIFYTFSLYAQFIQMPSEQTLQTQKNQTLQKAPVQKTILPDLVVEKIELDSQNRIVFRLRNRTIGDIDRSSYDLSVVRVSYGANFKDYPLKTVDPKKTLSQTGQATFTTDIVLNNTSNVKVEVDFNKKIAEEDENNNWLSVMLSPRFELLPTQPLQSNTTQGQAIPKEGMHKKEQPRIIPRNIRVIYPHGGEKFIRGEKQTIKWEFSGPHTSLKIFLTNTQRQIPLYSCYSTTNSFEWTIEKNIPVGSYKIEVITEDKATKAESGWFEVGLPPVDLTVWTESRWENMGPGLPKFWHFKIKIKNEGTKTLNNVLFKWIIIRTSDNTFVKEGSAGIATMHPNIVYEYDNTPGVNPGQKVLIYVDPDNYHQEPEILRSDNKLEITY